jgi:molecular chaperone GrpE
MGRIPIDDINPEEQSESQSARDTAQAGDDDAAALRAERDQLYERLARATAEFQNIRKRNEQELEQRIQYANSTLIKSLLPVIDNFERALSVDPAKADAATLLKGMQIVHDQWLNVLKQQHVEEIAPVPGTPFDPNQHQALMQQDSQYQVPTVVQLLQKGYALHGRTLRPAQVAVSRTS